MAEKQGKSAGLFDMRIIIGALIGLYGLIILVTGFFTSDTQMEKADGLNINVYAGIGMIVVAAMFAMWARLRPIVVPEDPADDDIADDDIAHDDATERPTH